METAVIEQEAAALITRAAEIVVVDANSYAAAGAELTRVKAYQARVREHFAPHKKAAHAMHAALCADEQRCLDLPLQFERETKKAMLTWETAERQRATEAQRIADAAARKEAEARQLEEAAAAEAAGDHAAAESIAAAPTFVAPVIVAPSIPKVAGIASRKTWDFRVTNLAAVPREYLLLDAVKVRKIVSAMGAQTAIPGVEVFERSGINAGAR